MQPTPIAQRLPVTTTSTHRHGVADANHSNPRRIYVFFQFFTRFYCNLMGAISSRIHFEADETLPQDDTLVEIDPIYFFFLVA